MENKFLWLCAFIDVLETLYVGIYKIGSLPLIFLHSYFWGLDVFSLWRIFSIEFEPLVKSVTLKQYVSQSDENIPKIHRRTATLRAQRLKPVLPLACGL